MSTSSLSNIKIEGLKKARHDLDVLRISSHCASEQRAARYLELSESLYRLADSIVAEKGELHGDAITFRKNVERRLMAEEKRHQRIIEAEMEWIYTLETTVSRLKKVLELRMTEASINQKR